MPSLICILPLCCTLLFMTAALAEPVFGIREVTIEVQPSNIYRNRLNEVSIDISCYDIDFQRYINCAYSHRILSTIDNGGHEHTLDRPPLEIIDVTTPGANDWNADHAFGSTGNGQALITQSVPVVAGEVMTETFVQVPPGWICLSRCYTEKSWIERITYDIREQGSKDWVELPALDFYIRCPLTAGCTADMTPQDPHHTAMFYGKPELVTKLIGLANLVAIKFPGHRLRFTDMSLPKGGLFDIHEDWTYPHRGHRLGVNADISYRSIMDDGTIYDLDEKQLDIIFTLIRKVKLKNYHESAGQCIGDARKCLHIKL